MGPIPTVGVLVFKDNKVLLVRPGEISDHPKDTWGLPAGRVENGESDIDAAIRELNEETGLVVSRENLILLDKVWAASLPRREGEPIDMVMHAFIAKNIEGDPQETSEAIPEWVEIDRLNELNLIPNVHDAINEGLKHLQ